MKEDVFFRSNVYCPSQQQCSISCIGTTICSDLNIFVNDESNLDLQCDESSICQNLAIHADNSNQVIIN